MPKRGHLIYIYIVEIPYDKYQKEITRSMPIYHRITMQSN